MAVKRDVKQRFAAQSTHYTQHAYQAALNRGQHVVKTVDGELVETRPDGMKLIINEISR